MKLFIIRKKSVQAFKSVSALDVASNAVLFFYGLRFRYGMDEDLLRLSREAVDVCSAICERLKSLEK